MKKEEFEWIFKNQIDDCKQLLLKKSDEYVINDNVDRLAAFKVNWLNNGNNNPKKVLWGYLLKHLNSIHDMCDNSWADDLIKYELWVEKITDAINYLILLRALIWEHV